MIVVFVLYIYHFMLHIFISFSWRRFATKKLLNVGSEVVTFSKQRFVIWLQKENRAISNPTVDFKNDTRSRPTVIHVRSRVLPSDKLKKNHSEKGSNVNAKNCQENIFFVDVGEYLGPKDSTMVSVQPKQNDGSSIKSVTQHSALPRNVLPSVE